MRRIALLALTVVSTVIAGLYLGEAPISAAAEVRSAPARGDDLILITIDTLRADALEYAGNRIAKTPNLDRLAKEGRDYTFAHAQNVVTLPSHTNILTGLYPFQHGVRDNTGFVLRDSVPTMATILHAAGYATAAFVSAFTLDSRFGLNRGFDVYDDHYRRGSNPAKFVIAERRGDKTVALAMKWWKAHAGHKRFMWVHLYDPHAAYDPPPPFKQEYAEHPYLGEVAATDSFLGPLLEPYLNGKEPPAVIVMTGDHGESLGEHGEETHGLFAYEATLHVPLILWGPGVPKGVDGRLARHIDILPTVLDLLGVPAPPRLPGRSLLAPLPKRPIFSYFEALTTNLNRGWAPLYGILQGHEKYIDLPIPELYDLRTDPNEHHNIINASPGIAARLKKEIPAEALAPPRRNVKVSSDTLAKLRSLGYLSGQEEAPQRKKYTRADDPKVLVVLDQKIHRLIDLYSRGHYEEAVKVGREVVAERPNMAEGYDDLALALRELNRGDEAVALLRGAVKRGVKSEALDRQLGQTLDEMGHPEEALEVLSPYRHTGTIETRLAFAVALSDVGKNSDARTELEEVMKNDPGNPKVYENLGIVALRQNHASEARSFLEHALSLNPNLPISLNTLGVALFRLGQEEGALDAWAKSVKLDPSQYDALFNIGLVAAHLGKKVQAKRALEQFIRTAPPGRFKADISTAKKAIMELEK